MNSKYKVFYIIVIILITLVISIFLSIAILQQHYHTKQLNSIIRKCVKFDKYNDGPIQTPDNKKLILNDHDSINEKIMILSHGFDTKMYHIQSVRCSKWIAQVAPLLCKRLQKLSFVLVTPEDTKVYNASIDDEQVEIKCNAQHITQIFSQYPGVIFSNRKLE